MSGLGVRWVQGLVYVCASLFLERERERKKGGGRERVLFVRASLLTTILQRRDQIQGVAR